MRIVIGILGVLASITLVGLVGLLGWVLWGFWLEFFLVSAVYTALAVGIIWVLAWYYNADFQGYLRNNNTWFYVLLGASVITLVIACFNFGPAVLLPEKFPTPEQRGVVGNIFNHLLYGKGAPTKSVPTEPLPWATGTWFWWKAWGLYCFLTFGYFFFAFWDEASHAFHATANFIRERREEHRQKEEQKRRQPAPGGKEKDKPNQPEQHDHEGSSGLKIFSFSFLAEILGSFVVEFLEHRRRGGI